MISEQSWKKIDEICDRFEQDVQRGPVDVADYLPNDCVEQQRKQLLAELLKLDIEIRRRRGKEPTIRDYVGRFPSDTDVVEECIASQSPATLGTTFQRDPKQPGQLERVSSDNARTIEHYWLEREIARGGMGIVYLATDARLDRQVALKVILTGQFASDEELARFQAEAQSASKLDHPHIVPIFEIGGTNGCCYISMGYVSGGDLNSQVQISLFAPREAAALMLKLSRAVGYAHDRGIVHRDIKPANVLIDDRGDPKLTDFGLAKNLNSDTNSGLTRTGQLLGTPAYMAPEQARSDALSIGTPTDIYSLGAVLYFMLTGRPPLRAATVTETLRQVEHEEPLSPRRITPQVDRDLETICLKCLGKRQQERYPSANALADDLQRYLDGKPIEARPVGKMTHAVRWCRRHPALATLGVATVLLILSAMVGFIFRQQMLAAEDRMEQAEEIAASRQETAETAEFFRLLHEAALLKTEHEPGWTWEVEHLLERAHGLAHARRDAQLMRETILSARTSFDLRHVHDIKPDFLAGSISFSPDGRYLALGESIDEARPSILVFETSDPTKPVHTFSFFTGDDTERRIARGDSTVDNGVRSLAFNPAGNQLAAGTRFGEVLVFELNARTREPKRLEVKHEIEVSKLCYSHDGSRLYALARGHRLRQWTHHEDAIDMNGDINDFSVDPTGHRIAIINEGQVEIRAGVDREVTMRPQFTEGDFVCISSNGRQLAVANYDRIDIFDLAFGLHLRRIVDSRITRDIATSQFVFDGRSLISPAIDWLHIWDATSGRLIERISASGRHWPLVVRDPSGRFLAIRAGTVTKLYEYRSSNGRQLLGGLTNPPESVAFNGNLIHAISAHGAAEASGSRTCTLSWNCESGQLVSTRQTLDSRGNNASNRKDLVEAYRESVISNCEPLGICLQRKAECCDNITTLGLGGASRNLELDTITAESNRKNCRWIEDSNNRAVYRIESGSEPTHLRITVPAKDFPDEWEKVTVSALLKPTLQANVGLGLSIGSLVKGTESYDFTGEIPTTDWNTAEFANADLLHVAIATMSRDQLATEHDLLIRLEPAASTAVQSVDIVRLIASPVETQGGEQTKAYFNHPRLSADGKVLWAVLNDEYLCSWDLVRGKLRTRWPETDRWMPTIYDLKVGERYIYTCTRDGTVQLSNPCDGQLETQFSISDRAVNNLDLVADSAEMIVSGDAGHLDRRQLPGGELIERIASTQQRLLAQSVSADREWLATGDSHGKCVLWRKQARTYAPYLLMGTFDNPVVDVAFSADARYLAVVVYDQTGIQLFDLHDLNHAFEEFDVGLASPPDAKSASAEASNR